MHAAEKGRQPDRERVEVEAQHRAAQRREHEGPLRQEKARRLDPGRTVGAPSATIGLATGRLGHREIKQDCQQNARQTRHREGDAPVVIVVDPAADEVAEERAEIGAGLKDRKRTRARLLREVVRNHRVRRPLPRRLADPDAKPRQRQLHDVLRQPTQGCHGAPQEQPDRDDRLAVAVVSQPRRHDAEQAVEQHKGKARQQAHHRVR